MAIASSVVSFDKGYIPSPDEPILDSMLQQYERVLLESIITSFGLDFIVKDQHGGDVDTILNVRKIGSDPEMKYKNIENQTAYENRERYDYDVYHDKNPSYQATKRDTKKQFQASGEPIVDAYTGGKLYFYSKGAAKGNGDKQASIDHVLTAHTIHNDPGRVLSGLNGEDLANSKENLVFTNASLNSSMGATKENEDVVEIPDYISKHPELPEETKNRMMCEYNRAKKAYEAKLAHAYYLSPKFKKDLAYAAGNVGLQMGIRQVLGFVFAEMWFSVKEEFQKFNERDVTLKDYLEAVAHGIQTGLEGFKEKYPELASKFLSGAVAGALSSLTTTLCNIFFTTAKNTVRIIRQSYASLVEAMKVLFINPDDYEFGDRMRAVIKVLSVGASVTVGVLVSDAVAHTPLGALGKTGDIVQNFCGAFVTGIMSCTLLMYLDRSELMNTLVQRLNDIHTIETELNYYWEWAKYFEQYAAQLMQIDLDQFEKEGEAFRAIASRLDDIQTEDELNQTLKQAFASRNLPLPWADFPDFNAFMSDKSAHLVFQ